MIFVNDEQPANAPSPIEVMFVGILIFIKLVHPTKVFTPILAIESERIISCKQENSENA